MSILQKIADIEAEVLYYVLLCKISYGQSFLFVLIFTSLCYVQDGKRELKILFFLTK